MRNRIPPSREELEAYIREHRNWARWGDENQAGAMNLITPDKRIEAASLVKAGRSVSLAHPLPVRPAANNPEPVQHFTKSHPMPDAGGVAVDYIGIHQHGFTVTHLDALCHAWDKNGMWGSKNPQQELTYDGSRTGSVEHWRSGFMTRAVFLNVPKFRNTPYVTNDAPVHGWELEDIVKEQGVEIRPGDAVVLYSGLEAYSRDYGPYGREGTNFPGIHASCLPFIRDRDIALWCWDMTEMIPNGYGLAWSIHSVLFAFGVGLVDNACLEPLAQVCEEEGRFEFMLTVNPLVIVGGTGSPVNPVAVF